MPGHVPRTRGPGAPSTFGPATRPGGGDVALDGLSAGTSTTTGDLTVSVALVGTSAGTSTTTGALNVAVALAGSSAGSSTATGALSVAVALAGTSAGSSTDTGYVIVAVALAGTSAGTSTTSGTLGFPVALAGTSAGTSASSGDLTVTAAVVALNGLVALSDSAANRAFLLDAGLTGIELSATVLVPLALADTATVTELADSVVSSVSLLDELV
jgi:hypothetical protein